MTKIIKIVFLTVAIIMLGTFAFIYLNQNSKVAEKKFSDSNETFSFSYNPVFSANEPELKPTNSWRLGAKETGQLLASVYLPIEYMPKTNFAGGSMTVGRSTDINATKTCRFKSNNETIIGERNISGYNFTQFKTTDQGEGNIFETTSYRGIVDGDCYAIEYTIHSLDVDNYPAIKTFDRFKLENDMDKILNSFKFLINSD